MGTERYTYGWEKTIHGTTAVNIERDPKTGEVVAVWFRCQPLPFTDHLTDPDRATQMRVMYAAMGQIELLGVDLEVERKPTTQES